MNNKKLDIEINTPPEGFKASLRSRIIVGLILVAIFVPAFIFGGWICFFVFMAALALILIEVCLAPQKKYGWWVWAFTFIVAFSYVYWFVLKYNIKAYLDNRDSYVFSLENHFSSLDISIFGIGFSLLGYFAIALFDKNFTYNDVAYFFLMTILVGLGIQGFYFIRYYPFNSFGYTNYSDLNINGVTGKDAINTSVFALWTSAQLEIYVLLGVISNDIFAYFGGVFLGKHKMIERISPKKTWEGFAFGYLGSVIVTLAFGLGCAFGDSPMLPFLDKNHWYWILALSLFIPLLANLGDLSFSLIKRHFGIKDYGNILRGHGGVLDRADSSIFAMIGVSIAIVFIANGFNFFL